MADVILETGTEQDYETLAEAYGIIPTNADDVHAIRCKVAETLTGMPTWVVANTNLVKHRLEADPAVRHDGETASGVIIDGGALDGCTIQSNDVIIQDLHFNLSTHLKAWIRADHASALRTVIRRCTGGCDAGKSPNLGFFIGASGSIWFCTGVSRGTLGQIHVAIGSIYFSAGLVADGGNPSHMCNLGAEIAGRIHGHISLFAVGGRSTEYTGGKTTSESYNLGEGEVPPGTDPIDLTSDLGISFTDVFKSTDGTNWGIKDAFIDLAGVGYGGIDVSGFDGFEALDVYGNPFDPANMVVGPKQPALAGGGGPVVNREHEHWFYGVG